MRVERLVAGRPVFSGEREVVRVVCAGRLVSGEFWLSRGLVSADEAERCGCVAVALVDGVPVCGRHERQVLQCKRSRRSGLPRWFLEAHANKPLSAVPFGKLRWRDRVFSGGRKQLVVADTRKAR